MLLPLALGIQGLAPYRIDTLQACACVFYIYFIYYIFTVMNEFFSYTSIPQLPTRKRMISIISAPQHPIFRIIGSDDVWYCTITPHESILQKKLHGFGE